MDKTVANNLIKLLDDGPEGLIITQGMDELQPQKVARGRRQEYFTELEVDFFYNPLNGGMHKQKGDTFGAVPGKLSVEFNLTAVGERPGTVHNYRHKITDLQLAPRRQITPYAKKNLEESVRLYNKVMEG